MIQRRKEDVYRQTAVLGSSPEQLVPLMYEHLLVSLKRAGLQIRQGDIEGKARSLQKASDIVFELMGALDFDQGGELAPRLASLYAYITREIGTVGRTLDVGRLDQLVALVAPLHESWVAAAAMADGSRPDSPPLEAS